MQVCIYIYYNTRNLVAPASPAQELGTVQTGTEKVDPARIFKCTTAARVQDEQ